MKIRLINLLRKVLKLFNDLYVYVGMYITYRCVLVSKLM